MVKPYFYFLGRWIFYEFVYFTFFYCSQIAYDKFAGYLTRYGEFLPIHTKKGQIYIYHHLNAFAAADESKTVYEVAYDGPLRGWRSVGFVDEVLAEPMVFRSTNLLKDRFFAVGGLATPGFVDVFQSSGNADLQLKKIC